MYGIPAQRSRNLKKSLQHSLEKKQTLKARMVVHIVLMVSEEGKVSETWEISAPTIV